MFEAFLILVMITPDEKEELHIVGQYSTVLTCEDEANKLTDDGSYPWELFCIEEKLEKSLI